MTSYQQPQIEPSLPQWSDLLAARREAEQNGPLDGLRKSGRRRLVDAAEQFVLRLNGIARQAGLPDSRSLVLTGDPSRQPIVMAGHQPVIFHSGLTFKYETTEQFASDQNAIAVAVVIDTDDGDAGQFRYPRLADLRAGQGSVESAPLAPIESHTESLALADGMMAHSQLKRPEQLNQLSDAVKSALRGVGEPLAAESAGSVLQQYANLADAGASMMEANLILRWLHGIGGRVLELPLSAIAAFPETLALIANIMRRGAEFAVAYNRELGAFRNQHNIRNAANPFRDLHIADDRFELPFWVVDHGQHTRHALHVAVQGDEIRLLANGNVIETLAANVEAGSFDRLLLRNLQIIPRAALITTVLRLLFADLFVHGTGGGHYEPFNNCFARSWWNIEPTPFVVASASRYLLTEQRAELDRLDALSDGLRDLQHNPQRHFDDDVFSADVKARVVRLANEKLAAVDRMQAARANGESASDIGREIQQLGNQIKAEVTEAFQPRLTVREKITQEHRDAVNNRMWPWFLFPG